MSAEGLSPPVVAEALQRSVSGTLGSTQFQDLKELLKRLEEGGELGDKPPPFQIQERVHTLCRKFLGGSWKDVPIQELILTRMKGGMSNMLFLCQLPPSYPPRKSEPDKTLLRVYFNPETESHLVAESVIFTLLSERALGPRLFGIFNGGRLEEFIVSRPLACAEIRDPTVSQRIAKKLARVHHLSVPIEKDAEYLIDALERFLQGVLNRRSRAIENIPLCSRPDISDSSLNGVRVEVEREVEEDDEDSDDRAALEARLNEPGARDVFLSMSELASEFRLLKRCIKRSHSPVVFCHNDLQEGNILLPKTKMGSVGAPSPDSEEDDDDETSLKPRKRLASVYEKDLVLIDFEYASYNYRSFDFANHFCEMGIEYTLKTAPFFSIHPENFPSEDAQRLFFTAYREGENELDAAKNNQIPEAVDPNRVEKLIAETRPFVAVSHFFWGVWALLQLEVSPIEFGFEAYAKARLAGYFEWRGELVKLLDQAPPPKSPIPSRHTSGDKTQPPPQLRLNQLTA